VAFRRYGNPNMWRGIAEANGIDDPMRLRRGRELNIPRLES
jgi:nucleoid-associated protein YgaU